MFKSITIICSRATDPYVNLALEDQLLLSLTNGQQHLYVFFYTNRPCVVFGNFQNPWLECDLSLMRADDVWPVRRQSGGGAVYHDEGNLNFSFIQTGKNYDKLWNLTILQKALANLGIFAQFNERSDLILEGKKFSGSAFKQKKDISMHHGTLLIKSNLHKLTNYLSSKSSIVESKSIKSVRSKVINLSEKKHDLEPMHIIQSVQQILQLESSTTVELRYIDGHELQDSSKLNLWRSREHIFDRTPRFVLQYEGEHLVIEQGQVTQVLGKGEHHLIGEKISELI